MTRGEKKHLKRIAAPKSWSLSKLGGVYAPKPSSGPHASRSCIPLALLLRNQLKYALTYIEAKKITGQRVVKVDGKVRIDFRFPLGFMDVVEIEKTGQKFRMLPNEGGKFRPHVIDAEEAKFKLCKVEKIVKHTKDIDAATTHDGRCIRFFHPDIEVNDVMKIDLATGRPTDQFLKFKVGCIAYIIRGSANGRIGRVTAIRTHPGCATIVELVDANGKEFSTIVHNTFVIGEDMDNLLISIPKEKGLIKTQLEQQQERYRIREAEQQIDA